MPDRVQELARAREKLRKQDAVRTRTSFSERAWPQVWPQVLRMRMPAQVPTTTTVKTAAASRFLLHYHTSDRMRNDVRCIDAT
jgi:hypothetical protein